jgi:thymidylate kinase
MCDIIYLVGAFGCGKTTSSKKLYERCNHKDVKLILEDETLLFFLEHKDLFVRNVYYIPIMYYKLKKAIDKHPELIICDSHPFVSLLYGQAIYEINLDNNYSYKNIIELERLHYSIYNHAKENGLFENYNQTVIYINLPYDEHLEYVMKRFPEREKGFCEEMNINYFKAVRRVFNKSINHISKELYGCNLVEINDLNDLLKIYL